MGQLTQFAVDFVNNIIITSQSNLAVFLQVSPIILKPDSNLDTGVARRIDFVSCPCIRGAKAQNKL